MWMMLLHINLNAAAAAADDDDDDHDDDDDDDDSDDDRKIFKHGQVIGHLFTDTDTFSYRSFSTCFCKRTFKT